MRRARIVGSIRPDSSMAPANAKSFSRYATSLDTTQSCGSRNAARARPVDRFDQGTTRPRQPSGSTAVRTLTPLRVHAVHFVEWGELADRAVDRVSLVLCGVVEVGKVDLHGCGGCIRELFLIEGGQHRLTTDNQDVRVVHDRRRRAQDVGQLFTIHPLTQTRSARRSLPVVAWLGCPWSRRQCRTKDAKTRERTASEITAAKGEF